MFKKLFSRSTTKADIVMSVAAAIVAVWKAGDTVKDYQAQKENQ